MTDILALAERCERAEWPDRDLDAEISVAVRYHPYGHDHWIKSTEFPFKAMGNGAVQPFDRDGTTPLPGGGWKAPSYTSSLDAAMTLVPSGFLWRCGYSRHVPHQAELTDYKAHTGRYDGNSDYSRALALCAAALRAQASLAVVGGAR